jgi:hypothetical protein
MKPFNRRKYTAFTVALALFVMGPTAKGQDAAPSPPAITWAVVDGQLLARQDARTLWQTPLPDVDSATPAAIRVVPLRRDEFAVAVDATRRDGRKMTSLFVWRRGDRPSRPVWTGITSPVGDPGEETAQALRFVGPAEDGTYQVIVGLTAASVSLCGQTVSPLLYRRVYNPRSRRFEAWNGARSVGDPVAEIVGVSTDVAIDTAAPLRPLIPRSVSSAVGDGGDPMLHTLPAGLSDNDPTTGWIPAWGDGGGEFATFFHRAASWDITAVRIRPGLKPVGLQQRPHPAPHAVMLVTETAVFRLVLPDNPSEETLTFTLPTPLRARCISLVMAPTDKKKPRSGPGAAISGVSVVTSLGETDLPARLCSELGSDDNGETAADLLTDFGTGIHEPIRRILPELSRSGKRRAIRLLAERAPAGSADMLAQAALEDDEAVAVPALKGLRRAPEAAVRALEPLAASAERRVFERALRALAALNTDDAFAVLLHHVGAPPPSHRLTVRALAQKALEGNPARIEMVTTALAAAPRDTPDHRFWDLLFLAVANESSRPAATPVLGRIYADATGFDDRYRAVRLAALAGNDGLELLFVAAADNDVHIQEMAIVGLSALLEKQPHDDATAWVIKTLSAPRPALRMAALRALRPDATAAAEQHLKAILSADPWPEVRRLAVPFIPLFQVDTAVFAAGALRDPARAVRIAALQVATEISGERIDNELLHLLRDEKEDIDLRGMAAQAVAARCQTGESVVSALSRLLENGAEPLAVSREQNAAAQAAFALARIGTPPARKALARTRTRSNPAVAAAIDRALAAEAPVCKP